MKRETLQVLNTPAIQEELSMSRTIAEWDGVNRSVTTTDGDTLLGNKTHPVDGPVVLYMTTSPEHTVYYVKEER